MHVSFWRRPLSLLITFVILITGASTVLAQELSAYVSDTLEANPRVLEKVHVYRQALRDREAASSGWRPKLDLEGTVSHIESDTLTNNSQSDDYNSNRIELALSQNLFQGFDTENAIKQADARIQAALYDLYDTMDNVALEAVQAYLDVLKQLRLYELAKENVASHEETLEQISVRNRSGAGRRSELEQTEGRVARAFASMLAQYNNLEDALTRLHELLGRNIHSQDYVEPVLPDALIDSLAVITDKALQTHPALKVSQFNILAAQHNHRRANSAFYPSVDLRLAQEVNDNIQDSRDNDDELSLSLTFRYNLYNGGADRAERDKRISVIEEEYQFEARVRRQIINTLRLAHKADELLQKQLVYLSKHVSKSQETMVSYREEFFVGERDLIDLLDAKNEVNSAQNSYSEAYYDALAARYRVYEGMGELFTALALDVQVTEDDLKIAELSAKGNDVVSDLEERDLDIDVIRDARDQCDNSIKKQVVDAFGCEPLEKEGVYQSNQAPTAMDDEWSITRNGVLKITSDMLLANDSDAENMPIKLVNFSQPQSGKIAMSETGALVFRAADGFVGLDSFTYSISDEKGAISSAKVNIHIPEKISLAETQYVNFDFNSADITSASKLVFDQILRALKESPNLTLNVFTYTDSKGSETYNMQLSEKRAQAIIRAFEAEGVSAKRFHVQAMGEQNPIADNSTEEGRAINRRGEFILR